MAEFNANGVSVERPGRAPSYWINAQAAPPGGYDPELGPVSGGLARSPEPDAGLSGHVAAVAPQLCG
jgi:hypothetical protein